MSSMEQAIDNMISEIKKPVDQEINGSARKAELQSIKRQDYSSGFAERFSK